MCKREWERVVHCPVRSPIGWENIFSCWKINRNIAKQTATIYNTTDTLFRWNFLEKRTPHTRITTLTHTQVIWTHRYEHLVSRNEISIWNALQLWECIDQCKHITFAKLIIHKRVYVENSKLGILWLTTAWETHPNRFSCSLLLFWFVVVVVSVVVWWKCDAQASHTIDK